MSQQDQVWRPLGEAARAVGISAGKLSNMVKAGRIASKKDPRDERLTLIDLGQLRRLMEQTE